MHITKFRIRNFKGIRDVTLSAAKNMDSKVFCLVGLNESGKTTILEALSNTGRKPYDLRRADPSKTAHSAGDYQSFMPVSKRYNFSDSIYLNTWVALTPQDVDEITKFIESSLGFKVREIPNEFRITKTITYENSKFKSVSNVWSFVPTVRKPHSKKDITLDSEVLKDEWRKLADFVEPKIPQVLYFRNEVFDVPDKILISKGEQKKSQAVEENRSAHEVNEFYRDLVQDILTAIDPKVTIATHIAKRKLSPDKEDQKSLNGLLQKIGQHISATVMGQWETIFGRKLAAKRIQVSCESDPDNNVYLILKLEDGGEIFDISERSTGFRWFFAFILLSHYRNLRNQAAIFLYDEPASNLHSAAQKQLLACFSRVPDGSRVVYSTHSHYLISPKWLDSTFIVRNEATVEELDEVFADQSQTDISITSYRKFVANNPSGISYFQPILDVIKFVPSEFETVKPAILVEGKGDFYLLSYLTSVAAKLELTFNFIPCMGSGTVDDLIALYSGWGKSFFVLLDADASGEKEKKRYVEKFGSLVRGRILTYADLSPTWEGKGLEKLFGKDELIKLQHACFPSTDFSKKIAHIAVQELLIANKHVALNADTLSSINKIVSELSYRVEQDKPT